jgi:hypothetical protein
MNEEFGMRNSEFGISARPPTSPPVQDLPASGCELIQNSKFKIQNWQTGLLG